MKSRQACLTFALASADHEKRVNNNDQSAEKCCLHMRQAVRNQADFSGVRFALSPCGAASLTFPRGSTNLIFAQYPGRKVERDIS